MESLFVQRFVASLLKRFAHEGSFDVDLRSEAERKEITTAFEDRGCGIVKYENLCRVTVTVPRHLIPQLTTALAVAENQTVQESA